MDKVSQNKLGKFNGDIKLAEITIKKWYQSGYLNMPSK